MNLLLVTPYLEQKKGPFVWAKNFAKNFSNSYEGLYILTFHESPQSIIRSSSSFTHIGFNIEKKIIKYPYISLVPKLIYLEKKYKIDVVQTNDTLVSFCAIIARMFTKVPVVLRVGGEYFNEICQWSEEQSEKLGLNNRIVDKTIQLILREIGSCSMKHVNQLIAVNSYMQAYLKAMGFDSQIIYNAVDINDFVTEKFSSNINSILTISNMTIPKKVEGIKLLIDAIHILKHEIPSLELKIAGDGIYSSYLKNYVNGLSLTQNIIFLGYVDNVRGLLKECSIYVHSSMQDVFPNSILEAMASKKPVIAINVGGISEIITNKYNGILCEPNAENIAKNILELRNNGTFRRELAERGFLKVKNEFSWDRVIDMYLEVYKGLI